MKERKKCPRIHSLERLERHLAHSRWKVNIAAKVIFAQSGFEVRKRPSRRADICQTAVALDVVTMWHRGTVTLWHRGNMAIWH